MDNDSQSENTEDSQSKKDIEEDMDDYIEKYKRRIKSITQKFNLLNIVVIDVNNLSCYISSESKKLYIIDIFNYRDENDVKITCTCPDNMYKKYTCKHIYWLGSNHIGISEPKKWNQDMIDTFILLYSRCFIKNIKGRNEDCPICLKHINYNSEFTVCCTKVCYNSIHTLCWYRYYLTTYSNKCVMCRSKTLPSFVEYNDAGLSM